MRYSTEDFSNYDGGYIYGRVGSYDNREGKGHVVTEDGKDVFLSSWDVDHLRRRIAVGSIIKFKVKLFNDMYCAKDIEFINKYPSGNVLALPNGKNIYVKTIKNFGFSGGENILKRIPFTKNDLEEHGYSVNQLDNIFIKTSHGEYVFFGQDSPITGDGKVNIDNFLNQLKNKFLSFDNINLDEIIESKSELSGPDFLDALGKLKQEGIEPLDFSEPVKTDQAVFEELDR